VSGEFLMPLNLLILLKYSEIPFSVLRSHNPKLKENILFAMKL
jgi:hypothetical protein